MIRKTSENDIHWVVNNLIDKQARWDAATHGDKSATIDTYADEGSKLISRLSETTQGRAALEALLSDGSPGLRLGVSAAVIDWNPDMAVPILANLMFEDFDSDAAPWANAGIRMHARLLLMQHFGLADFPPLPDRLADMGIKLPDWLKRELRRE